MVRYGEISNLGASSGRQPWLPPRILAAQEKARKLMREPFLDDNPMNEEPPKCSLENFKRPQLRRCPYSLSSMTFIKPINSRPNYWDGTGLDGGLDGFN
jgi:hypothetical protein